MAVLYLALPCQPRDLFHRLEKRCCGQGCHRQPPQRDDQVEDLTLLDEARKTEKKMLVRRHLQSLECFHRAGPGEASARSLWDNRCLDLPAPDVGSGRQRGGSGSKLARAARNPLRQAWNGPRAKLVLSSRMAQGWEEASDDWDYAGIC